MNEESILYIINYFNQYPDQPPEVLVKNIISSGYDMTDLKEALRRMGISPIVIPGYVEPEPPPPKQFPFKMLAFIAAALLIIASVGALIVFSLNQKSKEEKKELSGQIQQGVIPLASPSSQLSTTPEKDSANSAVGTYTLEVNGNLSVIVLAADGKPIGVSPEIQDNKASGSARVIQKTTIKGIDPAKSEFYDIKLEFKDMYKAFLKFIALDRSTKPKQMIVFHELQEQPGNIASIHLETKSIIDTLELTVVDASGSARGTIPPTYVLDSKMSADITPPKTTISTMKQSGKDVLVLTANDENSGIYKTEYSFDNGQTVLLYKDPIPLDTVPTRTIDFTSTDRAGNAEPLTRQTF